MNSAVLRGWRSLLTSPLAENKGGSCALRHSIKKHNKRLFFFLNVTLAKHLRVSSHVPTLKHKAKHGYITQKQLFQLRHETNEQPFPGYTSMFSFEFSVGT